jgi:hypothetical protein
MGAGEEIWGPPAPRRRPRGVTDSSMRPRVHLAAETMPGHWAGRAGHRGRAGTAVRPAGAGKGLRLGRGLWCRRRMRPTHHERSRRQEVSGESLPDSLDGPARTVGRGSLTPPSRGPRVSRSETGRARTVAGDLRSGPRRGQETRAERPAAATCLVTANPRRTDRPTVESADLRRARHFEVGQLERCTVGLHTLEACSRRTPPNPPFARGGY